MTASPSANAQAPATSHGPGPEDILQMATGYWVSKTLYTGLELGVFEALSQHPRSSRRLAEHLDLPYDGAERLAIALTALGLIRREGDVLSNTPATDAFLVKSSPMFMAGMFDHFNKDLYPLWRYLPDAVREGTSRWQQAFGPDATSNPFETMYRDAASLRGFLHAMDALLMPNALAAREQIDFSRYHHLLDIGGAWGTLPLLLLDRYPQLTATIFDLPPVKAVAEEHIAQAGGAGRIDVQTGDMFDDPLPTTADLIVLGWILHDWDDATAEKLLRRCFDALPSGGDVLLLELVLDDDRSGPLFPALMSLNMLVATVNGRERTSAEFFALLERAGFVEPHVVRLHAPRDAIMARKP